MPRKNSLQGRAHRAGDSGAPVYVTRAQIVLLAAEGLCNDIIASRLDTPRQIVSKWGRNLPLCGRNSGLASVSGPLMLSLTQLSPLKLID